MSVLPASVIAVDLFGAACVVAGLGLAFAPARDRRPRAESPRATARLIAGTMIAALGASLVILFTLFGLETAPAS